MALESTTVLNPFLRRQYCHVLVVILATQEAEIRRIAI
jgi:hypothetical protein